ncbi:C39 family peptidase [Patescibacteria group bacterium]|nr:C39 family peptidase [Patescibacteria group bacterium]
MLLLPKTIWVTSFLVVAVALLAFAWTQRVTIKTLVQAQLNQQALPPAKDFAEITQKQPGTLPLGDEVPELPSRQLANNQIDETEEINLAVPFAPQAPHANWDQPYQDACEEATIIMVERYLRGVPLSLDDMDAEILKMVSWQTEHYGFFKDSNTAETVRLAEAFYPHLTVSAHYEVTADDIVAALAQGTPVVVLVDGRKLGNPYYTQPGPDKHTLVIKGIADGNFITNDPGTRQGADFVYPIDTVMQAMTDYDGQTAGTHTKSMILISTRS